MSGQGPFGDRGCGLTVLRLVAAGAAIVALFVALCIASSACAPADDTDPRDCGELDQPQHCEGQTP